VCEQFVNRLSVGELDVCAGQEGHLALRLL